MVRFSHVDPYLPHYSITMTPNPRQTRLLEEVRVHGSASIEALATQLDVTLQTVRRDVQRLSEAGLVARFHGGVRLPQSTTENIAYRQRQALNAQEKTQIAKAIASRVPNDCSLFLNIGTTIEAVARELAQHSGLSIITNNLNVATIMSDYANCEVIVTGGVVRGLDRGIIGEMTVEFIRQFKVDIGLIGISGIETDGTLRDFDYREVQVARAIIQHSREVWVAADHSKFNRPAMVQVAQLKDIDMLFTDRPLIDHFPDLMAHAGVECVVADHPGRLGALTRHLPPVPTSGAFQ
jgi:DeoR family glycerol-3-phosphate regulon repressor